MISMLHCRHFIQSVCVRLAHQLERLSRRAEDRTALRQDPGKIFRREHLKIPVDQSFVSILKSKDLHIIPL